MSSVKATGNVIHDRTCNTALGVLQASLAGTPTQAAANGAAIVFHRACAASSKLNNSSADIAQHLAALRELGVNA